MRPTFTVLIGSIGRPVLRHTLDSIARQPRIPGDQVIIGFDAFEQSQGQVDERIALVKSYGPGFEAFGYDSGYHWLGVEQINHALRTVPITGSHIFTVGDDDVFVEDAYDTIRGCCEAHPFQPVVYRFVSPPRSILWDKPRMRPCLISGCCIAAPRAYVELMHTRHETTHDYDWMMSIIDQAKAHGQLTVWLDYIGVIARPDMRGPEIIYRPEWRYAARVVDEYVGEE